MNPNSCLDWTPFWLTSCVFLFLAGWWANNMWHWFIDFCSYLGELTKKLVSN